MSKRPSFVPRLLCGAVLAALAGQALARDAAPAASLTAVRAAHWIDAESGRERGPVVVLV